MADLVTTDGVGVVVDNDDLARVVEAGPWRLGTKGYVITDARRPLRYTIRLHRFVLGLSRGDGLQVDHVNRNPLDNRKANLRLVTTQQNNTNKGAYRNAAGFVTQQRNGRWQARLRHEGRMYHLGTHDTRADATAVAERKREELRRG